MAATPLAPRAGAAPRRPAAPSPRPNTPSRAGSRARPVRSRSLRAVPDAPAASTRVAPLVYAIVATLLTAMGVFGVVSLNALAAEASFEARALEREIDTLTLRHDDLVAAVALLETPDRVREVAITRLGLIEPERPGFLRVDPRSVWPAEPKPVLRLDEQGR